MHKQLFITINVHHMLVIMFLLFSFDICDVHCIPETVSIYDLAGTDTFMAHIVVWRLTILRRHTIAVLIPTSGAWFSLLLSPWQTCWVTLFASVLRDCDKPYLVKTSQGVSRLRGLGEPERLCNFKDMLHFDSIPSELVHTFYAKQLLVALLLALL